MKTKKVPVSFNPEDQRNINELIDYMGIKDVYGDFPKAIKFSIKLTLSTIKNYPKVYGGLEGSELGQYLTCIKNYEKGVELERRRTILRDMADNV